MKTSSVAADILSWSWPTSVTARPLWATFISPLLLGSVDPFSTPPVHFLRLPPSHLSNGGIVLMDYPKQQRGRLSCHSTFTPPLRSDPLHPSVCNTSGNMHFLSLFFLNFPLSCCPGNNPLRFEEKPFRLDWPCSGGSLLLCPSK